MLLFKAFLISVKNLIFLFHVGLCAGASIPPNTLEQRCFADFGRFFEFLLD